ncbi:nuclear transport factor 2 family protein [Patulibacter defluvii]|uniref:nuclear transport factor 2 family protein n=1 Tax=Patulibacter defluvii TaxID=3095358 RepID=UPI002A754161|nr:nuclear transport factor 2 family protein [Patulibacter sp. DM4]
MGNTPQEIERTLQAYALAKNRHDVEAAVALCHPDASYESVGVAGRIQGHDGLRAFFGQLFTILPDYRGDFDGTAIAGDTAVVWGRFSGTLAAPLFDGAVDGARIDVPVTFVCRFRDGLLYSDTGYFDAATFYRQAGAPLPSIPAFVEAAGFVQRFAERWANPSAEAFREILDPETRNLYPGMSEPQGPDGIVAWLGAATEALPDLRLEVTRWATDGDAVLIEFRAFATVAGEPRTWEGADRFRLRDGRCIEGRSYFDTAPLASAVPAG